MARKHMPVEQLLALLAETPPSIAAVTTGIDAEALRAAPEPGEWSANEVLAHLRACADVWGDCIATILAEDHPTIQALNPKRWIKSTDYPELEFRPSLDAFTAHRDGLLALLEPLAPADWERTATVTGAGSPLERTLHSFADRLARHERSHIKQIERTVAAVSA